jgi:hypothetical protein
MSYAHAEKSERVENAGTSTDAATPGRRTRTDAPVQRKGSAGAPVEGVQDAAARGVEGGGGELPHHDAIQQSFGHHSLDGVRAHTGGSAADACESMGANAYATGQDVAFKAGSPDLHTSAHEAAHVVQQRGGVHLSGGVGQAGDPYEQHADAVADAVVAGRSAEGLLDRHAGAGGDGGGVQRQAVQLDGDDQALEDKMDAIASAYNFICLRQRDAVRDLMEDAAKEDPPPLWQTLLIAAAQVALAGALGGVGGAISAAVTKKLAGKVSEIVANAIATSMEDAAKDAANRTVTGIAGQIASSSSDPREIFFRGQRDTLTDTAMKQQNAFITREKAKIRAAKEPAQQADALLAAVEENYQNAYLRQRNETLDQWCSYQAKQALGKNDEKGANPGTNLGKQVGDTSAKGVLGIQIRVFQPGAAVTIERAEIEGLNEGLRKIIESRPLKSLKIPMTVKGYVGEDIGWAAWLIEKRSQPWVALGRNETGTIWMDTGDYSGLSWLHLRAHPYAELWGPGGPTREHTKEAAFEGARLLIEQDMANLTVSGKLSG